MQDRRRDTPAFHRNIGPITARLKEVLPTKGEPVLEIGSGSGQHIVALAKEFPELEFQPTEPDPENLASIDAWMADSGTTNVKPALQLDVSELPWPLPNHGYGALFCFNVIHITPWEISECLFEGADQNLTQSSRLFIYGPFMKSGQHTSKSNAEFQKWLVAKDPRYGIRSIEELEDLARENNFALHRAYPMPANNFLIEFHRKLTRI